MKITKKDVEMYTLDPVETAEITRKNQEDAAARWGTTRPQQNSIDDHIKSINSDRGNGIPDNQKKKVK